MSHLTFQQKQALWRLHDDDPTSFAGQQLVQPSHLMLQSTPIREVFGIYKSSFLWLKRLQSPNWNPKKITEHLVTLVEIWGYINSGVLIPEDLKGSFRFVNEASRIIFTAIHFAPDCMDDDSNILHPMYLEYPSLISELHEVLALLKQCRMIKIEFWSPIVRETGEELVRVYDLTMGNSELSNQLDRRYVINNLGRDL